MWNLTRRIIMAITNFSGPITAGNIRNTTGTTIGTNIANVGQVVMTQTHLIDLSGGALAADVTNIVIPANSQIIDVVIDSVVAASGATNLSVGDVAGGAATIINTFALGVAVGRKYPTTEAGGALAWSDVGTTDIRITVTASAATNAGSTRITFLYSQNNNLS
jgi:hypothetical protein